MMRIAVVATVADRRSASGKAVAAAVFRKFAENRPSREMADLSWRNYDAPLGELVIAYELPWITEDLVRHAASLQVAPFAG